MPSAIINTQIRSNEDINIQESIKALTQALGEVYSNKNLGLNIRVFDSATDTVDVSDSILITTGTSTIILPDPNSWSTTDVYKSPLLVIYATSTLSLLTTPGGGWTINGTSQTYYANELSTTVFYADYANSMWRTIPTTPFISTNPTYMGQGMSFTLPSNQSMYIVDHLEIELGTTITLNSGAFLEIG